MKCYGPNSSARCSARSHSGDVIYFDVCCLDNKLISHKLTKKKTPKLSDDHFYCPTCNYAARNQGNVTTHINRHHPGHNQVNNEYQKLMPHFLLFADDIALNGRNEKETQQLLDIIGKWCTDYGMSPGFAKCNYISDKNINLKLLDNLLDRTDSYKYLGLPILHEGIDFPSYMENQYTKTNTEFQRLKINGNYFANSAHRINVLKSHVLSHLEYAIQLISLRTEAQNSNIKPQKEKIEKLIKNCRKWANAPILTDSKLSKWMTNIWDYKDLLKYRQAALHEQILNLPSNNPLRILNLPTNEIKIPAIIKQDLLSLKGTNSDVYFQLQARQRETNNYTIKLSSIINSLKLQNVEESKGVIYTLPSRKKHKSKTDVVFTIRDNQTRRSAIRFRNRILYNKEHTIYINQKNKKVNFICTKCNQQLSCEHLTKCQLIKEEAFKNPKLWIYYQMEKIRLQSRYPEATNYTFLDFLLNNNHYRLFNTLYKAINTNAATSQINSPQKSFNLPRVEERIYGKGYG